MAKIDTLEESGSDIAHKQDITNTTNSYFCSVGKDRASKVEAVPHPMNTGK